MEDVVEILNQNSGLCHVELVMDLGVVSSIDDGAAIVVGVRDV